MVRINTFRYIQAIMRRQGITADTPEQVLATIATLYRRHSLNGIAAMFGVTRPTVTRWLKDTGVPLRARGGARIVGKPITLNGETRLWRDWFPPADWSQRERHILYQRLVRNGWPLDRALTEPLQPRQFATPRQTRRDARQRERWNDDENYDN